MSKINSMKNLMSMFHDMQVKGPVLVGQVFDKQLNSVVDTIEFQVSNKSQLPLLPFGVFGEVVNERNSNHAWVKVRVHPTYWDGAVVIAPWSKKYVKYNEYVCAATETFTVVAPDAAADIGSDVWESVVEPLDNVHSIKRTVTVTTGIDQYDDRDGIS